MVYTVKYDIENRDQTIKMKIVFSRKKYVSIRFERKKQIIIHLLPRYFIL